MGTQDGYAQVTGLHEVCNLAKDTSAKNQCTLFAPESMQTYQKRVMVVTPGMMHTCQRSSTHTSNLKAASAKAPTTS